MIYFSDVFGVDQSLLEAHGAFNIARSGIVGRGSAACFRWMRCDGGHRAAEQLWKMSGAPAMRTTLGGGAQS